MIAVEAIIDAAALYFRVARGTVASRAKRCHALQARRAAIFLADRHSGQSAEALARAFGVTYATIHNNVRSMEAAIAGGRAPDLARLEETARSIHVSAMRLAGMPLADAASVAHQVIVQGDPKLSSDEVRALAHAVLRATPPRDNPLVTELVVAAVETMQRGKTERLGAAVAAALRALEAPAGVPFQ